MNDPSETKLFVFDDIEPFVVRQSATWTGFP